jgi:magnesium chelatase subunit I
VVEELRRRALRVVFEGLAPAEGLASVVEAFEQGWQVEVSEHMPSREYLEGLEQIPGLREGAALLAGGDSPARLASAIEFILEGLHLQNRLNKTERDGKARYTQG